MQPALAAAAAAAQEGVVVVVLAMLAVQLLAPPAPDPPAHLQEQHPQRARTHKVRQAQAIGVQSDTVFLGRGRRPQAMFQDDIHVPCCAQRFRKP